MNDLTPCYEPETDQVVLEGLPAGVAGEAALAPVPGLELAFDRADGHLSRAILDTGRGDGLIAVDEPAVAMLVGLFGPEAPSALSAARSGGARALSAEPRLVHALSRLARLDATRMTSPVGRGSPWWAAEAAELAGKAAALAASAGLQARARAEARQAVRGLAHAVDWPGLPEEAVRAARAVAALAAADEPEAAGQLRAFISDLPPGRPVPAQPSQPPRGPGLDIAMEVEGMEKDQVRLPGLHWVLDPSLVPDGLFRPGLSPHSDLSVRYENGEGRLVVATRLAPGAEGGALGRCRVRLVDPGIRRVLAQASFGRSGLRARTILLLPFPLEELPETWVEVVEGEFRPVRSARGHRVRRALRWADAALRAERGPAGLAPTSARADWSALAGAAWERCRRDWDQGGDADRAFLAACRLASLDSRAARPRAPSVTAARLADRTPLSGPACLAEVLGE